MSILLIGDPHFKEENEADTTLPVNFILEHIKNTTYAAVILLGDILHDHRRTDMFSLQRATSFLKELAAIQPTYLILGNHDRVDNNDFLSDLHFFDMCNHIHNLHIVSKVVDVHINDKHIILVPYVPAGKFIEALYTFDSSEEWWNNPDKCSFICAHQELQGCIMHKNVYSKKGDKWLASYCNIYSGHIHGKQRYANIVYVGSMCQNDYSENYDKSILSIELATMQETEIAIPVRKKILVELTQDNFHLYTVPEGNDVITMRIVCHVGVNLKDHPLIQEWQKRGIRIKIESVNTVREINCLQNKEACTFLQKLCKKCQDNPVKSQILTNIFGTIKL